MFCILANILIIPVLLAGVLLGWFGFETILGRALWDRIYHIKRGPREPGYLKAMIYLILAALAFGLIAIVLWFVLPPGCKIFLPN